MFDTILRLRASGGKSHSKVTPTTWSPAPTAKRISVAEGRRDTMRTHARYQWTPDPDIGRGPFPMMIDYRKRRPVVLPSYVVRPTDVTAPSRRGPS